MQALKERLQGLPGVQDLRVELDEEHVLSDEIALIVSATHVEETQAFIDGTVAELLEAGMFSDILPKDVELTMSPLKKKAGTRQ